MSAIKEHNDIGQRCSGCKEFKPYSDFYKHKEKYTGYKSACKQCQRQRMNDYYQSPRGRKIQQERSWRENGIVDMTVERYEQMLSEQDGSCAICSMPVNKNGTRLCVDHDHKTGKTRGLLCHNCNTAIGRFEDRIDLLESAIEYLRFHKTKVVI